MVEICGGDKNADDFNNYKDELLSNNNLTEVKAEAIANAFVFFNRPAEIGKTLVLLEQLLKKVRDATNEELSDSNLQVSKLKSVKDLGLDEPEYYSYTYYDFNYSELQFPKVSEDRKAKTRCWHLLVRTLYAIIFEAKFNPQDPDHPNKRPIPAAASLVLPQAFEELTKAGQLFTDEPIYGGIFFHSKMIHLIQWALLILAVNNKFLDLGGIEPIDLYKESGTLKISLGGSPPQTLFYWLVDQILKIPFPLIFYTDDINHSMNFGHSYTFTDKNNTSHEYLFAADAYRFHSYLLSKEAKNKYPILWDNLYIMYSKAAYKLQDIVNAEGEINFFIEETLAKKIEEENKLISSLNLNIRSRSTVLNEKVPIVFYRAGPKSGSEKISVHAIISCIGFNPLIASALNFTPLKGLLWMIDKGKKNNFYANQINMYGITEALKSNTKELEFLAEKLYFKDAQELCSKAEKYELVLNKHNWVKISDVAASQLRFFKSTEKDNNHEKLNANEKNLNKRGKEEEENSEINNEEINNNSSKHLRLEEPRR